MALGNVMKQFYIGREGAQSGPFSESQVSELIATGQLRPDDLVWHDGLMHWQTIEQWHGSGPPKPTMQNVATAMRPPRAASMFWGIAILVVTLGLIALGEQDEIDESRASRSVAQQVPSPATAYAPHVISTDEAEDQAVRSMVAQINAGSSPGCNGVGAFIAQRWQVYQDLGRPPHVKQAFYDAVAVAAKRGCVN